MMYIYSQIQSKHLKNKRYINTFFLTRLAPCKRCQAGTQQRKCCGLTETFVLANSLSWHRKVSQPRSHEKVSTNKIPENCGPASADCWANLPEMNSCKQTCLKSMIDPMSEVTKLANTKHVYRVSK